MTSNFSVGKKIEDYCLMKQLGHGAYGDVYEAQSISTHQRVAIKTVPKAKLLEHKGLVGKLIQTEVQVLMQCNNENVVKMIKYLESSNNCYMVLEFCNQGDFEKYWKNKGCILPEKEALAFLKQILNGMKGLHEMNVIHRDLKMANILMHNGQIKIADLGFAHRLDNSNQMVQLSLGTLGTMAPEVIEQKHYGMLVDMFSLGAIYYQMLFGVLPFTIKSHNEFVQDVKNNPPNFRRGNVRISDQSQDLLSKMLQYDPRYRMKWAALYDHPLFNEGKGMDGLGQTSISVIASRQINMEQNKKLYVNNQGAMEQITNDNMFDRIQQNNPQVAPQQVEEDGSVKDLKQMQKRQELITDMENDINRTIDQYLQQRNQAVFLKKVLDLIHKHQHSAQTNVYLPVFMLTKKLLLQIQQLLKVINNNQNIFNCRYISELYNNQLFKNFILTLQEDQAIITDHFNIIAAQCKDIFSKMNNANQKIVQEIQAYPTPLFEENYKDTLINYYFQLDEERNNHSKNEIKNYLSNLMILILDSMQLDKEFKKELISQGLGSNIDVYIENLNFMTLEEKEQLINKKFTLIF